MAATSGVARSLVARRCSLPGVGGRAARASSSGGHRPRSSRRFDRLAKPAPGRGDVAQRAGVAPWGDKDPFDDVACLARSSAAPTSRSPKGTSCCPTPRSPLDRLKRRGAATYVIGMRLSEVGPDYEALVARVAGPRPMPRPAPASHALAAAAVGTAASPPPRRTAPPLPAARPSWWRPRIKEKAGTRPASSPWRRPRRRLPSPTPSPRRTRAGMCSRCSRCSRWCRPPSAPERTGIMLPGTSSASTERAGPRSTA